jgi:large subunit ribosomal protein L25
MAEQFNLSVTRRDSSETGKGANKRLRRQSYIPAVYYNRKGENIPVKMVYGTFESVWSKAHGTNIVNLEIEGDGAKFERPVLIWDVHGHPVKNLITHVDFLGVDLKQTMDMDVPVEVTGTAKGQEQGGIVSMYVDTLSVTCLPTAIPDSIAIDVTDLDINDNIYVEDIRLPEGVTMKDYDENFAVVGVSPPAESYEEELEAAEAEEGEEAEEGGPSAESEEGSSESDEE